MVIKYLLAKLYVSIFLIATFLQQVGELSGSVVECLIRERLLMGRKESNQTNKFLQQGILELVLYGD